MTLGGAEASDSGCGNKEGESDKRIVHEPPLSLCRILGQIKARRGRRYGLDERLKEKLE